MNIVKEVEKIQTVFTLPIEEPTDDGAMSRLINAALVDKEFCDLLLTKPCLALDQGCYGETFNLARNDRHFVLNTRASTLKDFAQHWVNFSNS